MATLLKTTLAVVFSFMMFTTTSLFAGPDVIIYTPVGPMADTGKPYHYVEIQKGVWIKRYVKVPYSDVDKDIDMKRLVENNKKLAEKRLSEIKREVAAVVNSPNVKAPKSLNDVVVDRAKELVKRLGIEVTEDEFNSMVANMRKNDTKLKVFSDRWQRHSDSNVRYLKDRADSLENKIDTVFDAEEQYMPLQEYLRKQAIDQANYDMKKRRVNSLFDNHDREIDVLNRVLELEK